VLTDPNFKASNIPSKLLVALGLKFTIVWSVPKLLVAVILSIEGCVTFKKDPSTAVLLASVTFSAAPAALACTQKACEDAISFDPPLIPKPAT